MLSCSMSLLNEIVSLASKPNSALAQGTGLAGSITSRCSGNEPALLRPDSRERRKSSLLALWHSVGGRLS